MLWRVISFLLCQALPALVVWFLNGASQHLTLEVILAALAGSYFWLTVDALRGMRLLRWLRSGDTSDIALGVAFGAKRLTVFASWSAPVTAP